MTENKRFFFLKLPEDFFTCKEIKKLRRIAGGDTHVIIALKILLLGLKNNNRIYFDGVEEDPSSELALEIDEDETNVKIVMHYLLSIKWLEQESENILYSPKAAELTDSITASSLRSRKTRNKDKLLQCNTEATPMQQESNDKQQEGNGEIEIEKEIDIDNSLRSLSCPTLSTESAEPGIAFPVIGANKEALIPIDWVENMQKVFTAIDCRHEIEKAKAWCLGNQLKSNWKKFLYNWFKRENDRRGGSPYQRKNPNRAEETRYTNEAMEVEL